jgi:uncharacterized membrane protein SpoIIM required for sporulation
LTPVDPQQASQISNDLNQTVTTASQSGALTQYIFGNNFIICLIMFIPIVGPLLGFYVLFNTGTVIGAIATAGGYPSIVAFVALFLTPIAWLEFASYSTAIAESVWLFRRITQGRSRRELKNAAVFVSICAVLLLLGAIIETALISIGA